MKTKLTFKKLRTKNALRTQNHMVSFDGCRIGTLGQTGIKDELHWSFFPWPDGKVIHFEAAGLEEAKKFMQSV